MASTQTSYMSKSVGTTAVTIFTASATTALVGVQVANTTAAQITVSVMITRAGVDYYLVKNADIIVGSSLALIGGDIKHFMITGDALKVVTNTAASADVCASVAIGV